MQFIKSAFNKAANPEHACAALERAIKIKKMEENLKLLKRKKISFCLIARTGETAGTIVRPLRLRQAEKRAEKCVKELENHGQ